MRPYFCYRVADWILMKLLSPGTGYCPKMKLVMMGGTLTQPGNCYDLVCENIINDSGSCRQVFHLWR